DVAEETQFLRCVGEALERLGRRRDESYHVVGRIPVFGSDHRAFADVGLPAYGFSIVPAREAAALRRFVLRPSPGRPRLPAHPPPPCDTSHPSRDAFSTLDSAACNAVAEALEAIVRAVERADRDHG